MTTLTEARFAHQNAPWRAALVVLCERFPDDADVWRNLVPGEAMHLGDLIFDGARPMRDRVLLAVAQSFLDPSVTVPFNQLVDLTDRDMRSVLDALAIARGGLPVD